MIFIVFGFLIVLGQFLDSVYSPVTNQYYIYEKNVGILKKDTTSNPPILCYRNKSKEKYTGRTLKIGGMGKVLVTKNIGKIIKVLKILPNGDFGNRLVINKENTQNICDFQVFGEAQNKICTLTYYGRIHLFMFNPANFKLLQKINTKFELLEGQPEFGFQLSICPQSRYLSVHTQFKDRGDRWVASRILIFEYNGFSIKQKTWVDMRHENFYPFFSTSFYGYFDNFLILAALTYSNPSTLVTYVYDIESERIEEAKKLRRTNGESFPLKIVRFGGCLHSCDRNGKLIKIDYFLKR